MRACQRQHDRAKARKQVTLPLDTGENCRHIVGGTPPVLQNIKTELAGSIHVGVEHLANEFDSRGFVRILFLKIHHQAKGSIFKRSIGWTDDNGIPDRDINRGDSRQRQSSTYQVITLSATGEAETPAGGSVCMRCNPRASRLADANEALEGRA